MKLVVGNWKENGNLELCKKFFEKIKAEKFVQQFVLCPPNCYLSDFQNLSKENFALGSQNCSEFNNGSHTGEISATMLKDFNVKYVIIGHNERRKLFCESNLQIKEKMLRAIENGITPILCVGENVDKEIEILKQIEVNFVVAYEPLWAIGTGKIETIENCLKVKNNIEQRLNRKIKFLYGGSVNLQNYKQYLDCDEIDGVLVGAESLTKNILEMCK